MSKKKQLVIRFGVSDGDTLRSSVWRCWSEYGKGQSELYLSNPALGGSIKTSFHESGKIHSGFTSEYVKKATSHGIILPQNRHLDEWRIPTEIAPGVKQLYQVYIPVGSVNIPWNPNIMKEKKISWSSKPDINKAVEFTLVKSNLTIINDDWPGKSSMGTELVGRFQMDDGSTILIVSRVSDIPRILYSGIKIPKSSFIKQNLPNDVESGNYRLIIQGSDDVGNRYVVEASIEKESVVKVIANIKSDTKLK